MCVKWPYGGMPDSSTTKIWTPIFELHVVRCGSKVRHQKDVCFKESEPRVQNLLTNSRFNGQHD